jgi:DNA-binding response OmpR family regulator
MRILIAEDERDIATTYEIALRERGHDVIITNDGKSCLEVYHNYQTKHSKEIESSRRPFDVVILDYKMPKINGMEVAKEILKANPKQRIIFVSAYVIDTLEESVKELKQVVELIQKPFEIQVLLNMIEDKGIFEKVQKLMSIVKKIKNPSDPSETEIMDLFKAVSKAQKGMSF